MKTKYVLLMIIVLVLSICCYSCLGNRTLRVYNWDDYINPELVKTFENKFKCKVEIEIYGSEAELQATIEKHEKVYDLIVASSQSAKALYEKRLLKDIDLTKIKNTKNIDLTITRKGTDPNMKYTVPYMINFTGILYNKNKVKNFRPSWTMYGRPELTGKIALLNDTREVIGAASKVLNYSYNGSDDIQLKRASDLVFNWKRNGVEFGNNRDLEAGLIAGRYDMIQDYNGDALTLMSEYPELDFVLPEEGTAISLDNFAIPLISTNSKVACEFINFFLDADNAKENMLYVSYIAPNLEAKKLLPNEFVKNTSINPPDMFFLKSEFVLDLGDDNEKYARLWATLSESK